MAKLINLKIDGKDVQAAEGTNLIDAAETAGIHIPNLCYMKGMKGIGACRLCLVEAEGGKAPLIACNTKVKEGMNISTATERVQEVRKFVIDLILSMHPLDCMTCTKAGVCNLQKYAYDFEIKESNFTRKKFGYPTDEANPFIKRDPEYCVLCSRCIRICKAQGTNVLEFSGRGVGAKVVTANDTPLQDSTCTFCGNCIDVCPVNAILESDRWRKGREWEYEKIDSVCLSCGNGCSISVSRKDGEVVKINSGAPEGAAERFLCAVGRFGFDSIRGDTRVTVPMKRVNGELKETTWEDALAMAAEKLKAAGSEAAFISSGNILNEDAALMKKLADVVKTKNIDSTVSLYSGPDAMNNATADLENADLFVLVGISPDQWKRVVPALDAVVRKRMNEGGAKLLVLNSGEPKIASVATAFLKGDEIKMLEELGQAVISKGVKAPKEMIEALAHVNPSDNAMAAADIFIAANAPVILAAPSLYKAAADLSLIKGDAVAVPLEANAKGVVMMGLTSEGKTFGEIVSSQTKLVYAVGEMPVKNRPDTKFLLVQTSYMTDLATLADLILPSAAALESEGTIIDYLGRIKQVNKVCEPAGESKQNAEIFMAVADAMGTSLKKVKDTDIKKAAKAKFKAFFAPFKRDKGLDIDVEQFIDDMRISTINGSRLLWLRELEKAVAV
ncbi:MAG: formate dehydrogenase, alpha subunit, archaeal-type [Nitrospirae bacterium]|nr:formate dehydrogenase, alpha subunit, archaeal-type [Nitrospirota bacterium]